eukprot:COSAG05_NODE_9158_length_643_cov_1.545956_1_plen_86_part_00
MDSKELVLHSRSDSATMDLQLGQEDVRSSGSSGCSPFMPFRTIVYSPPHTAYSTQQQTHTQSRQTSTTDLQGQVGNGAAVELRLR